MQKKNCISYLLHKEVYSTNDSTCVGLNNSSEHWENILLIHSDRNLGCAAFTSIFCLFLKQVLGINGEKTALWFYRPL